MNNPTSHVYLFLSAVSKEFENHRQLLKEDLKRSTLHAKCQEDFETSDETILEKLDEYIRACDAVIHLIGKMTGSFSPKSAVHALLKTYPDIETKLPELKSALNSNSQGLSYTQWEAYLALYHQRKVFIYCSKDFRKGIAGPVSDTGHSIEPRDATLQREHYERLVKRGRDLGTFLNEERLSSAVLRDLVEILPQLTTRIVVPPTQLRHTAERLIGRDDELTMLDDAWNKDSINLVVIRGKGGEGKTSLVASWMAELAAKNWRGAEAVFDWSFYDQGTRDQGEATSEYFLTAALHHFDDPQPHYGGPTERGARLARLVGAKRSLLVLDGLEPLQHPPGPQHGRLRDDGISALLRGLAGFNKGLCVVTTREKIDEVKQHYGKSAIDHSLEFLPPIAGAALLHYAGATNAGKQSIQPDDPELQRVSVQAQGHALTLFLLGQYLKLTKGGDILQRDDVKLAEADAEYSNDDRRPYGHAFKAIEAYEKWFTSGDEHARRQLAVLRLLSLFDRPAAAAWLNCLRQRPTIVGLTDSLLNASESQWKAAISRLQEINLVGVNGQGDVDCHPLLREYFAMRLRDEQPEAWRLAHFRLYQMFLSEAKENPTTLADLGPYYRAVAHGCQAGHHNDVLNDVYKAKIQQGQVGFAQKILGAAGEDLAALSWFFEERWTKVVKSIDEEWQAWLPGNAGSRLRALGRTRDALEPTLVSLERAEHGFGEKLIAVRSRQLSELLLILGQIEDAVQRGQAAVRWADKSGNWENGVCARAVLADAIHAQGDLLSARKLFEEAERLQGISDTRHPILYSLWGFRFWDLLIGAGEWRAALSKCDQVENWSPQPTGLGLLDKPLMMLTKIKCQLCRFDSGESPAEALEALASQANDAITKLHESGKHDFLPWGILVQASVFERQCLAGRAKQEDSQFIREQLERGRELTERGPMPLMLIEILLQQARLDFDPDALELARSLIQKHRFGRRAGALAKFESVRDARQP